MKTTLTALALTTAGPGTAVAFPPGGVYPSGTTAVQHGPNRPWTFSASVSPEEKSRQIAKVVEPLPDIIVAGAPCSRKNAWYKPSSGYFSSAGASSEL